MLGLHLIRVDIKEHPMRALHRTFCLFVHTLSQGCAIMTATVFKDVVFIAVAEILWAGRLDIVAVSALSTTMLLESITIIDLLLTSPHSSILVLFERILINLEIEDSKVRVISSRMDI